MPFAHWSDSCSQDYQRQQHVGDGEHRHELFQPAQGSRKAPLPLARVPIWEPDDAEHHQAVKSLPDSTTG